MRFIPKTWSKKQIVPLEKKSISIPIPSGSFLSHILTGGSATITARQAGEFYRNTSSVATAVDMIADSIEQIKPVILDETGQFITEHEILDLLRNPNGFDIWQTFIGTIARDYLLAHDSVITSGGNVRFKPIEIWPVSMQDVSVIQGVDNYPQSYMIGVGPVRGNFVRSILSSSAENRFYSGSLKELYHIRGYSSRSNKTTADSPLQAAANEARQIIAGKTHNLQILNNGGRLSLMIAFKDEAIEVDSEIHTERVQKINEQFAGVNNAGKIGVISNADISEIKEFGASNKDMDFEKLQSAADQSIYLRYGIPLPLVSQKASTFNNMQTGIELLYDNAVLPLTDRLFAGFTRFLVPRFGLDKNKVRITYDPEAIEALKKRRITEIETRRKINIETINELRTLIPGREPIESGGDDLYQPAHLVKIGEDLTNQGS